MNLSAWIKKKKCKLGLFDFYVKYRECSRKVHVLGLFYLLGNHTPYVFSQDFYKLILNISLVRDR